MKCRDCEDEATVCIRLNHLGVPLDDDKNHVHECDDCATVTQRFFGPGTITVQSVAECERIANMRVVTLPAGLVGEPAGWTAKLLID